MSEQTTKIALTIWLLATPAVAQEKICRQVYDYSVPQTCYDIFTTKLICPRDLSQPCSRVVESACPPTPTKMECLTTEENEQAMKASEK